MELTVASYNIHKGVGLDRRRDPERILAVLREIDADVVALQERMGVALVHDADVEVARTQARLAASKVKPRRA